MTNVVKFPYIASRHVHSRKPRISKNGTPEERAAKAPVAEKRPYLGNPLRSKIVAVSGAATIAGLVNYQSHDLSRIGPIGEPHLQELRSAAEEARYLASEFERAAEQLAPSQRCGENHQSAKAAEDGPALVEFLQKLRTYIVQEFARGKEIDQIFDDLEGSYIIGARARQLNSRRSDLQITLDLCKSYPGAPAFTRSAPGSPQTPGNNG